MIRGSKRMYAYHGICIRNSQYSWQQESNTINGFVEAAEFLGIDISPNDEYFAFGEAVLKPIYEENRAAKTDELMFNTEFVPKMSGHVKSPLIDLEFWGQITGRKQRERAA